MQARPEVLNHNIDTGKAPFPRTGPLSNPEPPTYGPVNVSVEVRLPKWLDPKYVFTVAHDELRDVSPTRVADALRFAIPQLEVSEIIVITSSESVRDGCRQRHAEMQALLAQMARITPVPRENWDEGY